MFDVLLWLEILQNEPTKYLSVKAGWWSYGKLTQGRRYGECMMYDDRQMYDDNATFKLLCISTSSP